MIELEISSYGNTYEVWISAHKQANNPNKIWYVIQTISINDRKITNNRGVREWAYSTWCLVNQLFRRGENHCWFRNKDTHNFIRCPSHLTIELSAIGWCWVMLTNDCSRALCVKLFASGVVWLANAHETWMYNIRCVNQFNLLFCLPDCPHFRLMYVLFNTSH